MTTQDGDVHTAVVLQGGGALGAYEYGVLSALYEQRPGFRPFAVAGISIGAITAAVLAGARDDPMAALDRLWRGRLTVSPPVGRLPRHVDQSLALLGNRGMYQLNPALFLAPWRATSIYETGPLRQTLRELVDLDVLNSGATRVVVGATNVSTGDMEFFDNQRSGGLTLDHVVASGSLPPGFPMTEVGSAHYWDGGLFSNIPLSPAINALEQAAGGDRHAVRELIVIELFPMAAPVPRTLTEVLQRMIQLQYTSRLRLDEKFFGKIDKFVGLMAEIDAGLPQGSALRRDPAYQALQAHRRIDHFNVVTSRLPAELSNPGDFSRASVEARIRAGYEDAVRQGIGRVDAPGLRPGVTGEKPEGGTTEV